MKKNIVVIATFLALITVIIAFFIIRSPNQIYKSHHNLAEYKSQHILAEPLVIVPDFESIVMSITDSTRLRSGHYQVTVTIHNDTEFKLIVDLVHRMEKYVLGQWTQVPYTTESMAFALTGMHVHPQRSASLQINLEHHHPLAHGQYRIRKRSSIFRLGELICPDLGIRESIPPDDAVVASRHDLVAEFTLAGW